MEKEEEFDEMIEDNKEHFEIDAGLFELRRKYVEMKKERLRSEKDANLLKNKIKMLGSEEVKVYKKGERDKKEQEENEKIRGELLKEKEMLNNLRINKMEEIQNKKNQINEMKEKISNCLTTWRSNLAEKNKGELLKMKLQKMENELIIEMNKKEVEKKNKNSCETIKVQKATSNQLKKKEEVKYF
jgi:hypothetical protein